MKAIHQEHHKLTGPLWSLTGLILLLVAPVWAAQTMELEIPDLPTEEPTLAPTATATLSPTQAPFTATFTPAPVKKTATPTPVPTPKPIEKAADEKVNEAETEQVPEVPAPVNPSVPEAGALLTITPELPYRPGHISVLERSGFIAPKQFESDGKIVAGANPSQTLFGTDDLVMIKLKDPKKARVGQTFIVYHDVLPVRLRQSKVSGVQIKPLAAGVIQSLEGDIATGALKDSFQAAEVDDKIVFKGSWQTSKSAKPKKDKVLKGLVLAGQNDFQNLGDDRALYVAGDIVYLDLGSEQGVQVNDIFKVIKRGKAKTEDNTSLVVKGEIRVLSTLDQSSIGQVVWSKEPVRPGNEIESTEGE